MWEYRQFVLLGLTLLVAKSVAGQIVPGNLIQNSSFEQKLPAGGWNVSSSIAQLGVLGNSVYSVNSGRGSLRLVPNNKNGTFFIGESFGISQSMPIEPVRGKSVYYGGYLKVEGAVTAILRIMVQMKNGSLLHREVRLNVELAKPIRMRDFIEVPNSSEITVVFLSCVAEGSGGSAFFDDIWSTIEKPTDWPQAYGEPEPAVPLTATVTIQAGAIVRTIPKNIYGQNVEYTYGGNGLWDVGKDSLNSELIKLGTEMGPKILRFPGGFLSDFYHWNDGVGPPGRRPITRSMPGANFTDNRFGTDEVLAYGEAIGAEVLFTVNALSGTPREAAEWVRYVNRNGRKAEYWEVGNELYVDLSDQDPEAKALKPDEYAERFNAFAKEMRAADPAIKIGAILDHKYSTATYRPFPDWSEVVLKKSGSQIDFVAVHNAFAPAMGVDLGYSVRSVYHTMLAAPVLVKASLAELSAQIDRVMGPAGSKVEVAVTEWAPLFVTDISSRFLEHPKSLAAALYGACILKAFIEDKRTTLAAAFKMVDALELSWIGIRNGTFQAKASHYVMHMFTNHFGTELLASKTDSPGYEARSIGWVDAVTYVPYLETVSSKSADGRNLYIMAINRSLDRPIQTKLSWTGFCALPAAKAWNLNGASPDSNTGTQIYQLPGMLLSLQAAIEPNGRFNLGEPSEIWLDELTLTPGSRSMDHLFPAHSVTAIELSIADVCGS